MRTRWYVDYNDDEGANDEGWNDDGTNDIDDRLMGRWVAALGETGK